MDRYDGQLPEDLRDIAERLSAARVTPSPLELDELRRRVHGRVERSRRSPRRSRFATLPRTNFVAVLLTMGLVLTTGVGVVLAGESIGGGGDSNTYGTTSFHHGHDASYCEYHGKDEHDYKWKTKHSTVTVNVLWDCDHLHIHISCGEPFRFELGNGPTNDVKGGSYDTTAPSGTSGLIVTADGSTVKLPFSYS